MSEPKFKNGEWYRCRVEPNGKWEVSSSDKKSVYFTVGFMVTGGEMAEHVLPWQVFVTEKAKEQATARFKVLDFDATKTDLVELEGPTAPITGKELWAKCEIQEKQSGGYYPARASDICGLNDRIPGGAAYKAALILGNVATKAPDPEAYRDNF